MAQHLSYPMQYPQHNQYYIAPHTQHDPMANQLHNYTTSPTRNDPPQRKRPKYTRSKTGCLTCRAKKIKCDEMKPNCQRCTHGQRECTWPEGAPPKKKTPARKSSTSDDRPSTSSSRVSESSSASPDIPTLGRDPWPPVGPERRHSEPTLHPLNISNPSSAHRPSVAAMHRGQSTHQLPLPVLDSVPEYPSTYSSHQSMIPAHGSYASPNPNTYLDHSVSSRNSSRPSTGSSLTSGRYHPDAPPNASPYGSSGGSYLQPSGTSSESYGPRSYSSQSYESEWNSASSYGSTVGPGVPASRNILGDRLSSHESSQAPSSHRYP